MKFANYTFNARGVNNLGDNMQIIAIDTIYENMGIPKEEIVYIDKNETGSYQGEYVILPVTMPLVDYTEGGISGRFSDHIIPVFLGLTLAKDTLLSEEVDYYHRFEPIGCRDERTMNTLRSYNISAYLHGCITATLPKRLTEGKKFDKVFIVDVNPEVVHFIPEDLKNNAEFLTHLHEGINDPKSMMQQYYDRYKNEGKLIITSLLHCSVPCMAAGIPVVLIKKKISYRFGWLEKLLKIYDFNDLKTINWYPEPVCYEEHKERLLSITEKRLIETYNSYKSIYDLSWYYEQRQRKEYIVDAFEPIKKFVDRVFTDRDTEYNYSIWGLTQMSTLTVNYISQKCPKAQLSHVYDSFRKVMFEGLVSESPEEIRKHTDEIVILTSNGPNSMAKVLFEEIGKTPDSYFLFELIK
ncbi:MAG: hypothetical protein WC520_02970 [Candidatus Paceibacterota bacterium]